LNCADFPTQESAQRGTGKYLIDPTNLDGDDDGIERETGRDPVDDQYTPKTPPGDIDNLRDVIPGTGARKVPRTGGPPIVVGALVLLGAALIVGRGVLKW
jgi:hypothetical protein